MPSCSPPSSLFLLAQIATRYHRAVAIVVLASVISVVTLHRMNIWFGAEPRQITQAIGLGPRHTVQWVPRDLGPLVAGLDRLGIDRLYTDYWLAYRLAFDTRERIIAAENRFAGVTFDRGQAVPSASTEVRYPAYEREVRRARHGFVFYRELISSVPIITKLERHGYRRHLVDSFVVYVPPPRAPGRP